jgi:polyhydroxybutyrate depolymerase
VPEVDAQQLAHASLESSGGTRDYIVYVPDSYDPDVPAPLAYVFHGRGSNKEQQLAYSQFQPYADEDGGLLVLPDALGSPRRWSPLGPQFGGVEGVNDLAFFDDLVAHVESSWCVDPERVLVSGMSSGGFMAGSVACTHSEQVTAAGPVTATVWAEPLCGDAEPVPYAYFHGTADPVVPYEGGLNSAGPVLETSQGWADQNGCEGDPVDERVGDEVVHRHWDGCEASTDLYTVEGGGHTWPGARQGGSGHTTQDIDATAIIWDTFQAAWPDAG